MAGEEAARRVSEQPTGSCRPRPGTGPGRRPTSAPRRADSSSAARLALHARGGEVGGGGGGDDEEEGIRPISGRLMEPMERSEEEDAALFNGHGFSEITSG